jgi:tRNA A37 threonylcarbamoyladenosine dehydratase
MSVVISDAWRQRFGGTARLYGEKALQCFADAHVCVVGSAGGLLGGGSAGANRHWRDHADRYG